MPSAPERRCVTRTRTWWEDRSGWRYKAGELTIWGSEAVQAVLEATVVAEGLSRLTLPQRRASTAPTRRLRPR